MIIEGAIRIGLFCLAEFLLGLVDGTGTFSVIWTSEASSTLKTLIMVLGFRAFGFASLDNDLRLWSSPASALSLTSNSMNSKS